MVETILFKQWLGQLSLCFSVRSQRFFDWLNFKLGSLKAFRRRMYALNMHQNGFVFCRMKLSWACPPRANMFLSGLDLWQSIPAIRFVEEHFLSLLDLLDCKSSKASNNFNRFKQYIEPWKETTEWSTFCEFLNKKLGGNAWPNFFPSPDLT